jgi:hypothetical protein
MIVNEFLQYLLQSRPAHPLAGSLLGGAPAPPLSGTRTASPYSDT